jgi:hypothetical protein
VVLESITHEVPWQNTSLQAVASFTTIEILGSQRITDVHMSSLCLDITRYPYLQRLTVKAERNDALTLQAALIQGIKICRDLESISFSMPPRASEVKQAIFGAIEACERLQSIALQEVEYTPVLLGRMPITVSALPTRVPQLSRKAVVCP